MKKINHLTIFIASPNDLQTERERTKEVVDRLNRHLGKNLEMHVDIRVWEDTLPSSDTPQEIINEDLKSSDLFLGLIWKRWGTPTKKYSSGFEEEFELARSLKKENKIKDIWLFFKNVPADDLIDPGDELKKVIDFKNKIHAEGKPYYKTFADEHEWSDIINDSLTDYLTRDIKPESQTILEQTKSKTRDIKKDQLSIEKGQAKDNIEISKLLSSIQNHIQQSKEIVSLEKYSKIRLYLFANSLIEKSYRSNEFIGNHELHLLYYYRNKVELLPVEMRYIFNSIIADQYDLKSGWYWLNSLKIDFVKMFISVFKSDRHEDIRSQSLKYYSMISTSPDLSIVQEFLTDSSENIKNVALDIFEKHGDFKHISILEKLLKNETTDYSKSIFKVIVSIYIKKKSNDIIKFIKNVPVEKRSWIGNRFEEIIQYSKTEHLKLLLEDNDSYLRSLAFDSIKIDLTEAELKNFIDDKDTSIFISAYQELIKRGNKFDISEIENKLRSNENKGMLAQSLRTFFHSSELNKIRRELQKEKSKDELMDSIYWANTDSHLNYEILILSHFDSIKDIVRNDLTNNFSRIKDKYLNEMIDYKIKYKDLGDKLLQETLKNEHYYECSLFKYSLNRFPEKAEKKDKEIIKNILDRSFQYSEFEIHNNCLRILEKYGNTQDVKFLLDFLIKTSNKDLKIYAAKIAINMLGKNKITTYKLLINQNEPEIIKLLLSNFDISLLPKYEKPFINLLKNENDKIRIIILAFLLRNFKKRKIIQLLKDYLNSEKYYYNVVCWIDRYLYCPGKLGKVFKNTLNSYL